MESCHRILGLGLRNTKKEQVRSDVLQSDRTARRDLTLIGRNLTLQLCGGKDNRDRVYFTNIPSH